MIQKIRCYHTCKVETSVVGEVPNLSRNVVDTKNSLEDGLATMACLDSVGGEKATGLHYLKSRSNRIAPCRDLLLHDIDKRMMAGAGSKWPTKDRGKKVQAQQKVRRKLLRSAHVFGEPSSKLKECYSKVSWNLDLVVLVAPVED